MKRDAAGAVQGRRVQDHQLQHTALDEQVVEDGVDRARAAEQRELADAQPGAVKRLHGFGEIGDGVDKVAGVGHRQLAAQDVQAGPGGVEIVEGHWRGLSGSEKPFPKARGERVRRGWQWWGRAVG